MPGESKIISWIRARARTTGPVLVGIGDDAAVIKHDGATDLIACCDLLVEGIHFREQWAGPRMIGRKALAVTLSDIAAMGASPRYAMVSVALPRAKPYEFIDELFQGIFDLADASGVTIIGGDTSSSPGPLFIDTSAIGECANGRAVTRAGAQIGDTVFVTETLGASSLGLSLLEQGAKLEESSNQISNGAAGEMRRTALLKHLLPQPRLKFGSAIGDAALATAMIDVSDGLSTDLCHILEESNCGAVIHAGAIPIAEPVIVLSDSRSERDPLSYALHGGEEYELLFTTRPEDEARVYTLSNSLGLGVTAIGEIVAGNKLHLERNGMLEEIAPSGFEHDI